MIYLQTWYLDPSCLVHFHHWVVMQQINQTNNEDCLRDRYAGANLATQVALARNTLWFLQKCRFYKRVPQSLRVTGMNALPVERGRCLIQEIETRALQFAIDEKKSLVIDLEKELRKDATTQKVDWGLVVLNRKKLYKKLSFFEECELTKWKEWETKIVGSSSQRDGGQGHSVAMSRKLKRKVRSRRRKLYKKKAAIEKAAHYALENNLVRNLSAVEVPLFSIAVLSYGPGFIPTPCSNQHQFKIDALNAANKQVWSAIFKDSTSDANVNVPLSLLKSDVTASAPMFNDCAVNQARDMIKNFASNVNTAKSKSKLNRYEWEGLRWLENAVKIGKIAVTQADKGGCVLIVSPELIISSTQEKLLDTNRYIDLGSKNPLPELRKELIMYWKYGVLKNFVEAKQSEKTVGLIYKFDPNREDPFTLSTSDKYKPGVPYPYPLFKVHKLTLAQLEDRNVRPPIRLVTDLHNSVSSRSDKFLVWKWLAPLCKDYAVDLVKDSSEALLKLDALEKDNQILDSTLAFGLDVVSLYDSLQFDLVKLALNDAMDCCRPDWSVEFRSWLLDLVMFSFESAVVNFRGVWYGVEEGVPTGGILSVSTANISVYYVFKKLIYSQLNSPLVQFIRFVDDGLGLYTGNIQSFYSWFNSVREKSVDLYGLDLTVVVNPVTTYTQFLDIRFKFNRGVLTTDIFRKPTDANRYLSFNSYHPRHMFKSIIYSQALRYRRIINNDIILKNRLDELKVFFIKSGYPDSLVSSILDDVLCKPRSLEYSSDLEEKKKIVTPWVVTYGPGFNESKKVAKEVNELLSLSDTWRDGDTSNIVQVVARRAPNLKDILFRRKSFALDPKGKAGTLACNVTGCQTCDLVSNTAFLHHRNDIVRTSGGNCGSTNLVYGFQCKICSILYVGKTVDTLRHRVNGHRSKFYDVLKRGITNNCVEVFDDEQIVGAHLVRDHGLKRRKDFNQSYQIYILAFCDPTYLRKTEQLWIDKLKTLTPFGLNQNNSVGDS